MRWFRGNAETPKLLSLSPLRGDEETESESSHFRATSRSRAMSPVRWARRKSSSPDSERNCYNVQTSQVTTEKCSSRTDKKRIQEERRRCYERKNPLLDRVKNTRLSFFKDKFNEEDLEDDQKSQCRSMCDLGKLGLTRNDFRRSVCELDLKKITEDQKTQAKRKSRSKSHTRLSPKKNVEEKFSILGFGSSGSQRSCWSKDDESLSSKLTKNSHVHEFFSDDNGGAIKLIDIVRTENPESPLEESSHFENSIPSSCLAAKFRAMQDRYLKSSTNRLISKIYRKEGKDREKRRLRSFSYGTLPGLEELRTNPLFEDHDQDDNDSGILDSGSATSSLLDDRCSSGASGLINSTTNDSASSQVSSREQSSSTSEIERNSQEFCATPSSGFSDCVKLKRNSTKNHSRMIVHNLSLGIEKDPLNSIYQAANKELIQKHTENSPPHGTMCEKKDSSKQLKVVRSRTYTTETIVVKLTRNSTDQSLGIFIAKTSESSHGYLVAHVVPNGLADKEGTLRIGDEILIVNGKRLKGLEMSEARRILGSGSGPGDVDIVISRYVNMDRPKKLKESSVDYENVSIDRGLHGVIVESTCSPKSHFTKHNSRHHRDKRNESNRSISSEKCGTIGTTPNVSNFCTLPRRPKSSVSTFHTVVFEKGPGKKSLGFTIVGGKDSPKGSIGIFIKSVLPGGQAAEDGRLRAGDEILAVNGQVSHDSTHREAVQLFRNIKSGPLALHVCRRVKQKDLQITKSCADLLSVDT